MKKGAISSLASLGERSARARKMLERACELFEAGERTRSVKLFLEAASLGNREAQVNVANIYNDGDGVERDFTKARYWYKRAIARGSPEAAYNLGIAYFHEGKNGLAKHWFEVAKSMGDEDAVEYLNKLPDSR